MLELEIKSIQNIILQYEILKKENIKLRLEIEELKKELGVDYDISSSWNDRNRKK